MKSERNLVIKLKEVLSPKFDKIWIHKKPSASKKFRESLILTLGKLPILQPEFDMLFRTFDGKLMAIETKILTINQNGLNMPYYYGIGQAMSLLRFGFDHVGLWLFVNPKVSNDKLHSYGAEAWYFIRNELSLPLEYSYFKVDTTTNPYGFQVMQYADSDSGFALIDIGSPSFKITWKYPNPLVHLDKSKIIRQNIEKYLNERE